MTFFRKVFMVGEPATGSAAPPANTPSPADTPAPPPAGTPAPAAPLPPPATPENATLLSGKTEGQKEESSPAAPEEIKVTFPEGAEVDKAVLDQFLPIAKKHGLKSAAAQEIVDIYVGMQKKIGTDHLERVTKWAEEARSDPEIGGEKFKANLRHANRVLERLGDEELVKELVRTGLANHKSMIRIFSKVGQLIAEDRMPGNGSAGPASDSVAEQVKAIFPNSPRMVVTE